MDLDHSLKRHFLLDANEHGMAIFASEASRDMAIASLAQNMKVVGYDMIALDENRAKNIYQYKDKIANELSDKTFIVVKGEDFFCSLIAQDVIRFYEKRAKFSKVLVTALSPVNKESEAYKVALDYAGEKLIVEEEGVAYTDKVSCTSTTHLPDSIGFYELLTENGDEYVFDVKKSMTSGMLKLRKDKASWKNDTSITGEAMVSKYFDYAEDKPSSKDMDMFLHAMRKMEIPPRMILL